MAKLVYRVGSVHGSKYVNTSREAGQCRPGGEEPEIVDALDAAAECERLAKDVDDAERTIDGLRMLLADLVDVCPLDVIQTTEAGKRAARFIEKNPLPPATAAERDGCRGYGV